MLKRSNQAIILAGIILIVLTNGHVGLSQSPGKTPAQFKKHVLTREFLSEGVAVGDVNKDGKTDILAGAYWFEAPHWKQHEIAEGRSFNPATDYSNSCHNFSLDVNLDGWIDLIMVGFPGSGGIWFENPKNKDGYWKKHMIDESVGVGNESPGFVDVDGDGRKDLLCADSRARQMVWLRAPTKKGSTRWERFPISVKNAPGTDIFSHGLGMGDINEDGRPDVMIKDGWWEAPTDRTQPEWIFHETNLGEDCSHMHVSDVNGDGLNDVISASAHKYGIWWYEQSKDGDGNTIFKQHEVSSAVSQTHASAFTDLNGDGHPDFVTGKRYFAHNDTNTDPGTYDPSTLLWFEFTPGKEPFLKAHEIDNDSGVGLNIITQDINKDGMADIVIANKKGVFLFENKMKKKRKNK